MNSILSAGPHLVPRTCELLEARRVCVFTVCLIVCWPPVDSHISKTCSLTFLVVLSPGSQYNYIGTGVGIYSGMR